MSHPLDGAAWAGLSTMLRGHRRWKGTRITCKSLTPASPDPQFPTRRPRTDPVSVICMCSRNSWPPIRPPISSDSGLHRTCSVSPLVIYSKQPGIRWVVANLPFTNKHSIDPVASEELRIPDPCVVNANLLISGSTEKRSLTPTISILKT
jgi:hypothetical protein